jgi:hypothetical protein
MNDSLRQRMNGRRWLFGRGQSSREEKREIAEAQSAGLTDLYLQGQRWATMIEAERKARRGGKHKAKYYR